MIRGSKVGIELTKFGHFQNSKSIFTADSSPVFLKIIFLSKYESRITTFKNMILNLKEPLKSLFSKNRPDF